MPKGIYERKAVKTSKEEIKEFVKFCFRDDIVNQLQQVKTPHLLAVDLYEKETGNKIKPGTAKRQANKWVIINGEIYENKK